MYVGKMKEDNKMKEDIKTREDNKLHEESKKKSNRENKIKVNLYLSYPNNVYYEMMISPNDVISNLLIYTEKFFPKDKYEHVCIYKNDKPIFTNFDTGEEIDISKTYIQHGFYVKESQRNNGYGPRSKFGSVTEIYEPECSIKIKLKITKLKEMMK